MSPIGGQPAVEKEVDETEWVGLDETRWTLTYERDLSVLGALVSTALK